MKEIEMPEPWERIGHLCYPHRGSKAYKHPSGENVHIISMYDTGEYIAQRETSEGEFEERKFIPYDEAVVAVNAWMQERSEREQ